MAETVAGARPLSETWKGTRTTYNLPPTTQTSQTSKTMDPFAGWAVGNLVQSYNQAYGEAKASNEQRYQQLLQIADQDYARSALIRNRMSGIADRTTGQRAADIRSAGAEEESNIDQRLRALGMSGTTVGSSLTGGVKSRTEASLNRLADEMQQTKLGIMREQAGATRDTKLGIMERRTDAYPDISALSGLIESAAGAGGGTFGALGQLSFGGSGGGGGATGQSRTLGQQTAYNEALSGNLEPYKAASINRLQANKISQGRKAAPGLPTSGAVQASRKI